MKKLITRNKGCFVAFWLRYTALCRGLNVALSRLQTCEQYSSICLSGQKPWSQFVIPETLDLDFLSQKTDSPIETKIAIQRRILPKSLKKSSLGVGGEGWVLVDI